MSDRAKKIIEYSKNNIKVVTAKKHLNMKWQKYKKTGRLC